MINFRKLKQDLSPQILREGQDTFKNGAVQGMKILSIKSDQIRFSSSVKGKFSNQYTCEVEIDREASTVLDSDCDCPYQFDCQHLSASLFYLEEHLDAILVDYSQEGKVDETLPEEEQEELQETLKKAVTKETQRKDKKQQTALLQEYIAASEVLGTSPFFIPEESIPIDRADLTIIISPPTSREEGSKGHVELKLALRVPFRSKPLHVPSAKEFLDAIRYQEPIYIGNRRFFFALRSFTPETAQIVKMVMDFGKKDEANLSALQMEREAFGTLLAHAFDLMTSSQTPIFGAIPLEKDITEVPLFCLNTLEEPLRFSHLEATVRFNLEYLEAGAPKLFIHPALAAGEEQVLGLEEGVLLESAKPGLLMGRTYYRFQPAIKRKHLKYLPRLRDITIPAPLFGSFVENGLPELLRFAEVSNRQLIDQFVTLPYTGELRAICDIQYLNGELEASLHFLYGKIKVSGAPSQTTIDSIEPFVTQQGILARNLTEEQAIIRQLFQDFIYEQKQGVWTAKNDKKIVEFMTEIIPQYQKKVEFNCPPNLLDQFIYDDTTFTLSLRESAQIDTYLAELKVDGDLKGLSVDLLWDCLASKRAFIELARKKAKRGRRAADTNHSTIQKILVLDLDRLAPLIQLFDELGINSLDDHTEERPLWSLASISKDSFAHLPIKFKMSPNLEKLQQQMLGLIPVQTKPVPKVIKADLRSYQEEGVNWLSRLRDMRLNGVLADDMGLGKTLQAIVALSQHQEENKNARSIVICPTSLVYNWIEEFNKFNPKLKVLAVDGNPTQRKKLIEGSGKHDILVTSYSLVQKDIEHYQSISFSYAILDEAQNIKNRGTRNAKSVKQLKAAHRLVLTGTPIENSLDELWSLFDFLMPGLLSSYDRFNEKFIRSSVYGDTSSLEVLRKKVSPFILRRMKSDVLKDLPPVSHITYHCQLTDEQRNLYRSYAESARKELSQLVEKEGFNKVQIQVLATLTRLKQICCHPAIFAKDKVESGDSAKYDMLMELLGGLIEGKHKTVIFSQYTRMLGIIQEDLKNQGIPFCYLDGSTQDRMSIVKQFNEDPHIPIFLVSLKAGGTGLNLVGADTVIHYDPWWNPAAEDQATDRVHRMGQKNHVSSYKLVTLGTIEEKIQEMQNRKRGLVKKVISSDEEAIAKLTWDEVLELLKV